MECCPALADPCCPPLPLLQVDELEYSPALLEGAGGPGILAAGCADMKIYLYRANKGYSLIAVCVVTLPVCVVFCTVCVCVTTLCVCVWCVSVVCVCLCVCVCVCVCDNPVCVYVVCVCVCVCACVVCVCVCDNPVCVLMWCVCVCLWGGGALI